MKLNAFKTLAVLVLAISTVVLMSAFSANDPEKKPNGSEDRKVASFSKIGLCIRADVFVTQGSSQQVNVLADKEDLEQIKTSVSDGKLTIGSKNNWFKSHGKITINITVPNIEELAISGSGYIETKGSIKSHEMTLDISGSGRMKVENLTVSSMKTVVSGSGSISLSGSSVVDSNEAAVSGSGSINALSLHANNVDASVSGSGHCNVYAIKNLNAAISGSGSVHYKGNAKVSANTSGSGKVINEN